MYIVKYLYLFVFFRKSIGLWPKVKPMSGSVGGRNCLLTGGTRNILRIDLSGSFVYILNITGSTMVKIADKTGKRLTATFCETGLFQVIQTGIGGVGTI